MTFYKSDDENDTNAEKTLHIVNRPLYKEKSDAIVYPNQADLYHRAHREGIARTIDKKGGKEV